MHAQTAIHVHAYSYTVTHGIYVQTNVDIVTSHMVTNIHTHTGMHAWSHTSTHTLSHTYKHMYMHTHCCACTHTCTYTHASTHTHTHTHTHIYKFICKHSTKQLKKYQAHIKLKCDALPEFFLMAQNDGVKNPFIATYEIACTCTNTHFYKHSYSLCTARIFCWWNMKEWKIPFNQAIK